MIPQRRDNNTTIKTWNQLPPLYSSRRRIKKKKFEDLQQLKRSIPIDFHDFYDNIPFED